MRKFLYLSPYFPPMRRVGALRPLKYARHLPRFGWSPVVLCDLWPGAPVDMRLLSAVPESTVVVRNYTPGAERAMRSLPWSAPRPWWERALSRLLNNPQHLLIGSSVRAALDVLAAHPCEAIVVNADPFEALLVGARVARRSGLPLVLDLRDPWSVCELRRKARLAPFRWLVDRLERGAVETASAVVLNTEMALADYRAHYPDLPPDRFSMIRNHFDAELIGGGVVPEFERRTLLFLGNLRPFVEGDPLLHMLAELAARGWSDSLQLVITGECPESVWRKARALGVQSMVVKRDFVPYQETGTTMRGADVLVFFGYRTQQRIPAKFYEYLSSSRPILALADHDELARLLAQVPNARMVGLDEPGRAADALEALLSRTWPALEPAALSEFTSQTASGRLAGILDRLCS